VGNSNHPGGEPPSALLDDNTGTKYLNFGRENSGFVVTLPDPTILESFRIATANDAPERDPFSFHIWGTNDPVPNGTSARFANWTSIDMGDMSAEIGPLGRLTYSPVIDFTNGAAYTSYRVLFPTVRDSAGANSMQVAEFEFFLDDLGLSGDVLTSMTPILAVDVDSLAQDSISPASGNEDVQFVIDRNVGTKYLNFGRENSGFIVTPSAAHDPVIGFSIVTANDSPSRDPVEWMLWGTDDDISSMPNTEGNEEAWVLIDSGSLMPPLDRQTTTPFIPVANGTVYSSYRMTFPSVRDPLAGDADSMQIAEVQFYDRVVVVPEPATVSLLVLSVVGLVAVRRRWA
jgi:hypothetical protein